MSAIPTGNGIFQQNSVPCQKDELSGTTAHYDQGLLCPILYTQPWALRRISRCSGQVVSLTRNPLVLSSQASLALILSTH
ncbi:hypothetical protein TNCV_3635391 [Trichonephila clavipes]|nr:hypothetical protein TNCV_3635391 [Trichonephila clavipes]